MDIVLNIYKTEISKKYKVDISLNQLPTLKDVWEEYKQINISVLIECICLQMNIMETIGLTFYAISMEDIYVCEGIFIICGKTINIVKDKFTFRSPPILDKKKYFHYPEFLSQKTIPCSFDKTVIYYSFGLVVLTCLSSYPTFTNGEYYINDEPIDKFVEKIEGKIHYFLKRCFAPTRELLFI